MNRAGLVLALQELPFLQGRRHSGRDRREERFWNAGKAARASTDVHWVARGSEH